MSTDMLLGERYQVEDPIGRGGIATVYRGRDTHLDRFVAIKVLREMYSNDPKFVMRFQREANMTFSLRHPNIVQVYDYGQTDGQYYIIMELIEGMNLRHYLRAHGILSANEAVAIAHAAALALGYAHQRGIIHRGIKPQDIMLGQDGSIKLIDFSMAMRYQDSSEGLDGLSLGIVLYYAPEQAQGMSIGPPGDVYMLGAVMHEMLTGRAPFDGDTPVAVAMQHIQDPPTPPSQLNPTIPPDLEAIILRCLEKLPDMRYSDGMELARALETWRASL